MAELFEKKKVTNTLSTEDSMRNLVNFAQGVTEKQYKNYTVLYIYIAQGQGRVIPSELKFNFN